MGLMNGLDAQLFATFIRLVKPSVNASGHKGDFYALTLRR